ncbi:MAG: sugar ABC transporter ATP-binding protein [Bacillota bacterium]|nr:sugar ABC transporter ATP-binding protein [Bacillota bacterium]
MKLTCENISKTFGNITALKNASLSVAEGEIRALLGGNGSGKSTIAKIIGGAVSPDTGAVKIRDKVIKTKSPSNTKKHGIVITSQELGLFTNLSVEENLCICQLPVTRGLFVNKKEIKKRAFEILKSLKLEHLLDKEISELAPNQQYMVEFAKALVQQPDILIIDEITSALYREDVEVVREIIHALKAKGCTVIFISHRMSEIYSICDTVTVMKNGEIVGTYKINEKNENELLSLMTGRDIKDSDLESENNSLVYENTKTILNIKDLVLPRFDSKINIEVKKGEIIGIAGLQGHGQSEFLKTVFGLQGGIRLEIDGTEKHITSPIKAVKSGLAFVSGDREKEGVFGERSVSENLTAVNNLVLKKTRVNEMKLLKDYGVVFGSTRQQITTLSGGNQQKVVIGRWTSSMPLVLLADDPTKGIDVQARRDIHKIFRDLADAGSAVMMVSSDDEELVELTKHTHLSRIIVMYEGNIVKTLMGKDITKENIIAYSMPKGGGNK